MKILIIDNYDSFTFNLFHYVQKLGYDVDVKRNDEVDLKIIDEYDKLILSPGPGLPSETTMLFEILEHFAGKKPILGVCLGMQGIAEFFGGKLLNQSMVKHGVAVKMLVQGHSKLFHGLPQKLNVGLYHSWCVDKESMPPMFAITGISEEGVVMSIENVELKIFGVQFHPESIMTDCGLEMLNNFLIFK